MGRLKFFSSELVLGSLVAILSILAALSGYQSSMADSDQIRYNVQGQQALTDASAEYLSANQLIVYDYTLYNGWYTAETAEKTEHYRSSFSEELNASMATNQEEPFNKAYYTAMYLEPQAQFDEADRLFELAEEFNRRGDALRLVLLISALGLALAAWASLLKTESPVRIAFGIFSTSMLVYSVILYLRVPVVAV